MADLMLRTYHPELFSQWNAFVAGANNGTPFHRLDFLGYHGDRFRDVAHHLAWFQGSSLFAVMTMGIFEENGRRVARSPIGASWGGLVHPVKFKLKYALQIVETLLDHLRKEEVDECHITPPPPCYFKSYSNHFEFALSSFGFSPHNREVTSVLALNGVRDSLEPFDSSARTQARKAARLGVVIERNSSLLEEFYPLLQATKDRLGGIATHTLDELRAIRRIDPRILKFDLARYEGKAIAGNMYFDCGTCIFSFYPSNLKEYAQTSALNLLFSDAVGWCIENGRSYLDFGCSSYQSKIVNPGVSEFKESFGAAGMFRDTYRLAL